MTPRYRFSDRVCERSSTSLKRNFYEKERTSPQKNSRKVNLPVHIGVSTGSLPRTTTAPTAWTTPVKTKTQNALSGRPCSGEVRGGTQFLSLSPKGPQGRPCLGGLVTGSLVELGDFSPTDLPVRVPKVSSGSSSFGGP